MEILRSGIGKMTMQPCESWKCVGLYLTISCRNQSHQLNLVKNLETELKDPKISNNCGNWTGTWLGRWSQGLKNLLHSWTFCGPCLPKNTQMDTIQETSAKRHCRNGLERMSVVMTVGAIFPRSKFSRAEEWALQKYGFFSFIIRTNCYIWTSTFILRSVLPLLQRPNHIPFNLSNSSWQNSIWPKIDTAKQLWGFCASPIMS